MTVVLTENIWSFQNSALMPRPGELSLGDENLLSNESDLSGWLYVKEGLHRSETIVFLGFLGLQEKPDDYHEAGYLVTRVDRRTGSGIVVDGDTVAANPRIWVNNRVKGMWRALHKLDYTLEDFGLPELDEYLRSTLSN